MATREIGTFLIIIRGKELSEALKSGIIGSFERNRSISSNSLALLAVITRPSKIILFGIIIWFEGIEFGSPSSVG